MQRYGGIFVRKVKKSGIELQKSGQKYRCAEFGRSEPGGFFEKIIEMSCFFKTKFKR
jgi:hypothetical protein